MKSGLASAAGTSSGAGWTGGILGLMPALMLGTMGYLLFKKGRAMKASKALKAVTEFVEAASRFARTVVESIDRIEDLEQKNTWLQGESDNHKKTIEDLKTKLATEEQRRVKAEHNFVAATFEADEELRTKLKKAENDRDAWQRTAGAEQVSRINITYQLRDLERRTGKRARKL
jgi:hypothetical protein